jgi:hypothetical protein
MLAMLVRERSSFAVRPISMSLRTLCATRLLMLLPLILPAAVQAQFNYTTNSGTITITLYTGSDGVVAIPDTINGLSVASIGDGRSLTIPA